MEDLQLISDAEQAAFCVELAKRLNMLRRQDHLCDITLVTKDNKEFKAHRNVLSAASPFFFKLLQSDMKENREGIVRFEEISGAVMEDVLEFIYTGSVEVTQENCKDLIAAANYLLIPGLKKLSGRFLEREITKSNCISIFYFSERYHCDELTTNTRKFIHANFASVAEMDEYLNLEAEEVERWISSDEITVAVEADVFNIVLKWIEQDKSERIAWFEQLFRHVRLAFVSFDFLLDVVTNELVRQNLHCFKLISDAIKRASFACERDHTQSPRKGLESRAIVACGGKYTLCYLPEKDEWKRLADGLSERNSETMMFSYRDQLYAFLSDGKGERYDREIEMDEFLNLEAKEVERWISSDEISVAAEADVFKIVLKWIEQNNRERKASFEKLFGHLRLASLSRDFLIDVVTNELVQGNSRCLWLVLDAIKVMAFPVEGSLPQSSRKCLETRAIICCGGKYTLCYLPEKDEWKSLADGLTEKINTNTQMMNYRDQLYAFPQTGKAERYDPIFNCWSTLDMSTTSSTKVAVVRGKIYAIDIPASSIKRYDVERCSWQTVSSSHEGCREESCVVAAGNHLYVCGGRSESYYRDYLAKAERFDTVENKWETIADMQQKRGCAFGAATSGKIFVAGGVRSLLTCEMYNISTNEWQVIGRLNDVHSCGSMVCFKGKLYVLGGTSNYSDYLSVECYDPTEDKWIKKTTIPVKMISKDNKDSFTGCVLKLSKGVLDKLDVIKDSN